MRKLTGAVVEWYDHNDDSKDKILEGTGTFLGFGVDSHGYGPMEVITYSTAIIMKNDGFLANIAVELVKLPMGINNHDTGDRMPNGQTEKEYLASMINAKS